MSDPVRAGDAPLPVDVEEGKTYFWCTCGLSAKQPFCDGSHQPTGFTPLAWTAPESKRVFFCTCKATQGEPLCDGSHNKPA
jgi:CDGSH-type Zn-finger protein